MISPRDRLVVRRLFIALLCLGAAACGGGSDASFPSSDVDGDTWSGTWTGEAPKTSPCKRGIAWPGASATNAQLETGLSWWYDWTPSYTASADGVVFAPMIWGTKDLPAAKAEAAIKDGAQFLLGFNEPNHMEQANLSASTAASLWPQMEEIAAKKGLALVSPAVNYCGDDRTKTGPCQNTNPVDYLRDFFQHCRGCRVDYVAVHWYNCDGASLKSYLAQFKQFNRPIWVTELACAYGGDATTAGQEKYMREAVPILEADPDVFRYAWFSADSLPAAKLLDATGAPTPLGLTYLSLDQAAGCAL
ncbi:MAG TPA: glycoside hydrolase family protein [Polyangia bacterium]|nr:glycoside hydrolase family protein [Polyangia bacterium]HVZ23310.1 glycoside hydrolase family protein [Vicinamibacterales bacterium]